MGKAAFNLDIENSQKNTGKQLDQTKIDTKVMNDSNIRSYRATTENDDNQEHYIQI